MHRVEVENSKQNNFVRIRAWVFESKEEGDRGMPDVEVFVTEAALISGGGRFLEALRNLGAALSAEVVR